MCGFRVALNGAQAAYGIRPDLTCLGKIIGGGLPVAAYGGKREIMDCVSPKGPVYQAGTLSGNPLAMTAGIATLDIISADPAWGKADYTRELSIKTKHVLQGFAKAAKDAGVKVQLHQAGSMFGVFSMKMMYMTMLHLKALIKKLLAYGSCLCLSKEYILLHLNLKHCLCLALIVMMIL